MARKRFIPDASKAPLAVRAVLALNGEEPPEVVQVYLREAVTSLEKIYCGVASEKETRHDVGQLRIFLWMLHEACSPKGRTRTSLRFQNRPGRPRRTLADVMRGLAAIDAVKRRVAEGWKKEAAIAEVREKLEMSRTEIFEWLKLDREFNLDLKEIYPELS
jgi:hypothetical protein